MTNVNVVNSSYLSVCYMDERIKPATLTIKAESLPAYHVLSIGRALVDDRIHIDTHAPIIIVLIKYYDHQARFAMWQLYYNV